MLKSHKKQEKNDKPVNEHHGPGKNVEENEDEVHSDGHLKYAELFQNGFNSTSKVTLTMDMFM